MPAAKDKIAAIREGDIVEVCFFDHAQGSDGCVPVRVYGKVVRKSKREIRVATWESFDEGFQPDQNHDWFDIFAACITRIRKLR